MTDRRSTAPQRRSQAVRAGVRAIADLGLTTSAVQRVAEDIGVSQTYVFRLFGSKQALMLACLDEMEARMRAAFRDAAEADPDEPLEAMGAGFRSLVADGSLSGFWLQACAAARGDEAVAARCRSFISGVLEEADRGAGSTPEELSSFLGRGALVLQLQALGVDLSGGSGAAVAALRAGRRVS
ncbi:TetR/AcrR family transcriptional regulator [Microbacterium sp. NPDC056234]|uniref:TetR/AcrR family transcriptional regulator n=1 Tax=Microbacterium sp. NPDC056234 TaxID=3345757 RepID=UPI0035DC99A0